MNENSVIENRKPYHVLKRTILSHTVYGINQNDLSQKSFFRLLKSLRRRLQSGRVMWYCISCPKVEMSNQIVGSKFVEECMFAH